MSPWEVLIMFSSFLGTNMSPNMKVQTHVEYIDKNKMSHVILTYGTNITVKHNQMNESSGT